MPGLPYFTLRVTQSWDAFSTSLFCWAILPFKRRRMLPNAFSASWYQSFISDWLEIIPTSASASSSFEVLALYARIGFGGAAFSLTHFHWPTLMRKDCIFASQS